MEIVDKQNFKSLIKSLVDFVYKPEDVNNDRL